MQKPIGGRSLLEVFQPKSMIKQGLILKVVTTKAMKKLLKFLRRKGDLGFFYFATHQNSVYNAIVAWSASNFCHA